MYKEECNTPVVANAVNDDGPERHTSGHTAPGHTPLVSSLSFFHVGSTLLHFGHYVGRLSLTNPAAHAYIEEGSLVDETEELPIPIYSTIIQMTSVVWRN